MLGYILLFIALYWLYTNFLSPNKKQKSRAYGAFERFDEGKYLVALLAKVAKSDGRVDEFEAKFISQTIDDIVAKTGGDRAELKAIYTSEKENLQNTYAIALEYRKKYLNAQSATARITFLLNLAYIDGELSLREREILTQIARGFGMSSIVLELIISRFETFYANTRNTHGASAQNLSKKDPYEILDIEKDASFEQIKKRYRELVRQHHPDILMGNGESEERIVAATKKLQEINEAYESIKKERGES